MRRISCQWNGVWTMWLLSQPDRYFSSHAQAHLVAHDLVQFPGLHDMTEANPDFGTMPAHGVLYYVG